MGKHTWVFIGIMIGLIGGGLFYRHLAQEVDPRGATRLMRAIEENDADKTEKLLNEADVHVRDKSGQTVLFYAAKHATDPKVIYKLIVAGADPFATDKAGNTPLTTAARYNPSQEVVIALAKQGHKEAQQQANKDKALIQAAKYNTAEIIETLLVANANPVMTHSEHRNAAVYLAGNETLTEQEKADYRQVMLVLEILQAREQFTKSMSQVRATQPAKKAEPAKKVDSVKKAPITKKEPVASVVSSQETSASNLAAQQDKKDSSVPQEKQMSEEKPKA